MRTFHRGAAVSAYQFDIPAWADARARRMFRCNQSYMERGNGLTCFQMTRYGNAARQRKKGPITRYGVTR